MKTKKDKKVLHETPKKSEKEEHHFVKESLNDKIAKKAYELYEERGRIEGRHVEDWIEAEKLITAKVHKRAPR